MVYTPGYRLDTSDFFAYIKWFENITLGQIPYVDYHVDYPLLFWIPVIISAFVSNMATVLDAFVFMFRFLMIISDAVVAMFVFLIAKRVYDEKIAFRSAILYATALSTAVYSFWKFDTFPLMFLMAGIYYTLENKTLHGYTAIILGFFTKLFPIIAIPFIFFRNISRLNFKDEVIKIIKMSSILVLLLYILPSVIFSGLNKVFTHGIGDRGQDVYATTLWYAIGKCTGIVFDPVWLSRSLLFIIGSTCLILLLYYIKNEKTDKRLLGFISITIFLATLSNTHYSPQFSMWLTPFLAIFLCASFGDMIMFYLYQAFNYLVYPNLYGRMYVNGEYLIGGSENPLVPALFFIMFWVFMIYINANVFFKSLR
ncbi:MAG: hypothetical protein AMQ22_00571 [Candidatus Methanofastidiosum methylothiophilum]|uniref:Glycosyltransferase RgtA/B/C/D-like domain-containing protein n=1 Tax=Candidatus Methanofastidiosum methylothiophilum TaxID=1705564 RepID=A0A150J6D7_9EURY|nr:MAG: hypothetical protein AMQ22_00571 [Candidatus Methanofastidiosum methylthiophilus]